MGVHVVVQPGAVVADRQHLAAVVTAQDRLDEEGDGMPAQVAGDVADPQGPVGVVMQDFRVTARVEGRREAPRPATVRREEGEGVVTRIRGPAGSVVNRSVRSPHAEPRNVAVTRGRVQLTEGANRVRYAILPESDIGYLLLPRQTTSSLITEVAQSLTLMTQQTALRD